MELDVNLGFPGQVHGGFLTSILLVRYVAWFERAVASTFRWDLLSPRFGW